MLFAHLPLFFLHARYFTAQIALVTSHGGDVIKFAGDALMAMWVENLADKRPLSCLRAAQCAMHLQEKLGKYKTRRAQSTLRAERASTLIAGGDGDGSVLSIKISLGYGRVTAFHVGGERRRCKMFCPLFKGLGTITKQQRTRGILPCRLAPTSGDSSRTPSSARGCDLVKPVVEDGHGQL